MSMTAPTVYRHKTGLNRNKNTSLTRTLRHAKTPRNRVRKSIVTVTIIFISLVSAYYIHALYIHFRWARLMLELQRRSTSEDSLHLMTRQAFGQAIAAVTCTYLPLSLVSSALASCGTYQRLPPIGLVQAFNETAQVSQNMLSLLRRDSRYNPDFLVIESLRLEALSRNAIRLSYDFKDKTVLDLMVHYANAYTFVLQTNRDINMQARRDSVELETALNNPIVLNQCLNTSTDVRSTALGDLSRSPLLEMTEDFAQHLTDLDRFCESWKSFLQRRIDKLDRVLETGRVTAVEHDAFVREHLTMRHALPEPGFTWRYINWLLRKTFDAESIKSEDDRHEEFVNDIQTVLADVERLEQVSDTIQASIEQYESVCRKPKEIWTRFERGDYVGSLVIPCRRARSMFYGSFTK